jgi:hypothetical protein
MAEWRENQLPTPTKQPEHWVMYFDSSLKLEGTGARVLLISPKGEQLKRPSDLLEGLKEGNRVRSFATWALSRNIIGHQVSTSLWRLHSGHQPS